MRRRVVRVLLLDASPQRRQRLKRVVEADPQLALADAVGSVEQALQSAARRQAEVILLAHGPAPQEALAAIRSIMQARATPIVVLAPAAPVDDGLAFALMEAGALAVLRDPGAGGAVAQDAAAAKLRETLHVMSEVKVVRRWASTGTAAAAPAAPRRAVAPPSRAVPGPAAAARRIELVAIGASTGGPVALKELLCQLPPSFPVPILIVQHMADGFLDGLAAWLTATCPIVTEIAAPGVVLRPGHAYLAPDGAHMRLTARGALAFDAGPPLHGHRPAVASLLASVAAHCGRRAIGILLTGMGRDGAAELKLMKDAGAITIAQDEASSAVHGMPGEAIRCGGATYVMNPHEIGAALPALVLRGRET